MPFFTVTQIIARVSGKWCLNFIAILNNKASQVVSNDNLLKTSPKCSRAEVYGKSDAIATS